MELPSSWKKSFLVVTALSKVVRYYKPQLSLMPDVNSTFHEIGHWKYLLVTYLTKAFYQIPFARDSMKYCGVVSPFRGVRVYTLLAMGIHGSEIALKGMICRALGDLLEEDIVL